MLTNRPAGIGSGMSYDFCANPAGRLGEVEVSVRQLEALLSISYRSAFEAIQRLVKLNLLQVLDQPVNRPGRYRIGS